MWLFQGPLRFGVRAGLDVFPVFAAALFAGQLALCPLELALCPLELALSPAQQPRVLDQPAVLVHSERRQPEVQGEFVLLALLVHNRGGVSSPVSTTKDAKYRSSAVLTIASELGALGRPRDHATFTSPIRASRSSPLARMENPPVCSWIA